jgi:hypothetical protein
MKNLQKRQQTLINLITRVGGRQNIQKWMDEILKIDIKLETKAMFKINVSELHIEIQKKLAEELNGTLDNSGLVDVIVTSVNPENLDWYKLEIAIYGEIDDDSDRLYECVSWVLPQETTAKVDTLLQEIQAAFHSLNDWYKYQQNGAPCAMFNCSFERAVKPYCHGLNREYWGEAFASTGKSKNKVAYDQGLGFAGNTTVDTICYTVWEYAHADGTAIWTTEKKENIRIATEQEILAKVQNNVYEYCQREKITFADLVASIEKVRVRWEQDELAKIAASSAAKLEIPEPEWVRKEIYEQNLKRFWIGDDYLYSYCWCPSLGIVWEHCDDRTKGMAGRVKTSSNLGSSRDVVMARIDSLLEQRSRKSAQERAKEEGYEAYKKAQQSNRRPVKSFEKWLQTVA